MGNSFDINRSVTKAISFFWGTKSRQLKKSMESSNNRGAVVAGKQLDGFIDLIRKACLTVGIPESCIYTRNNFVPGYFRSSKDWDVIVISPNGELLAVLELKSQVGSYGNNFNNRCEEALGNATDFWKAYREKEFPTIGIPWVGYLMVIGEDEKSTTPVKTIPHIIRYCRSSRVHPI